MFHFENVTNVKSLDKVSTQASDIKLYAGNKIRLSANLVSKLELKTRKVLIQMNPADGSLFITSVDTESKEGRPVNGAGEFSHEVLHSLLKGIHSEWNIDSTFEAFEQGGLTYYKLKQTVDGTTIKADLDATLPTHTAVEDAVVPSADYVAVAIEDGTESVFTDMVDVKSED